MTLENFPFKIRGNNLDIIQQTAPNYESLGTLLLDDGNGAIVSGIQRANADKPVPTMREIYKAWVNKGGASWNRLIQCLRMRQLNVLADDIDNTLKRNKTSMEGGSSFYCDEFNAHCFPPPTRLNPHLLEGYVRACPVNDYLNFHLYARDSVVSH